MKKKYLIILIILFYSCSKEVDLRDQFIGYYEAKIVGSEAFLLKDSNQNNFVIEYKDSLFGHFNIVKSEYPDSILLFLDSNLNFLFLKKFNYMEQLPIHFVQKAISLKIDTSEYIQYYDKNDHYIYTKIKSNSFELSISKSYHTASYSFELTGIKLK